MEDTKTTPKTPTRRGERVGSVRVLFTGEHGAQISPATALRAGSVVLGRAAEDPALLSLRNDSLSSRTHATLERKSGRSVLADQGSRNGTFVNGVRVTETVLADGDVIRVGSCLLLYREDTIDGDDLDVPALVGRSPAMRALRHRLGHVAQTTASVLLLGESGVGKSLAAREIHARSGRDGPFVAVNCAAIPEQLADSQLFGHVAGAFTGAQRAHDGFFRAARGGTLFLDEVAELPLAVQAKLLGVLEERAIIPVGTSERIKIDVRVIAATNAELSEAVRVRAFRGDLFARLNELSMTLPSLRCRREDILPMFVTAVGDPPLRLATNLAEALLLYPWPFNVRELRKVALDLRVRVSSVSSFGPTEAVDVSLIEDRLDRSEVARPKDEGDDPAPLKPAPSREELERLLVEKQGVISEVALAVGRSRKQVYRWIEHHGLAAVRNRGR